MKRTLVALLLFVALAVYARYYLGTNEPHNISRNIDGQYLVLDDGSLWEVSIYDRYNTRLWLPMAEVVVIERPSCLHYEMINTDEGEKACVELIKP